jgi:hypothetical protein
MLGAFVIAKLAAQIVVTASTTKVVAEIIKNNVTAPTDPLNRGLVKLGGVVIGGVVGDHSAKYIGSMIDSVTSTVKNRRDKDAAETEAVEA